MWPFAMRHYTARLQQAVAEQLGARLPRLPPFGTKVFVRKRSWQMLKEEFVEKVVVGLASLCPSMDVSRGFLVRTEDGHYLTTMVLVENVKEVSGEFEVDASPAPTSEPGARHRVRGKKPIVAKMGVEDDEHLLQDEELAEAFLEEGNFNLGGRGGALGGFVAVGNSGSQPPGRSFWPMSICLCACGGNVSSWRSGWGNQFGAKEACSVQVFGADHEGSSSTGSYLHYPFAQLQHPYAMPSGQQQPER